MSAATLITTSGAVMLLALPAAGDVLYDNGPVNGMNGYSNARRGVFGFRRTLLDDFVVPAGGWTLQSMHWRSVYQDTGHGDPGFGAEITLRTDDGGTPGLAFLDLNLTAYSEVFTGNVFFSRNEIAHSVTFTEVVLAPGHYWFEATVRAPGNNFWLTADQQLNECWVNYEDLGGLQSGTDRFGVASDINFVLGGLPGPGAFALLGVVAFAWRPRRRP